MSSQPKPRLSVEEYLELERKAEYKNEFFQGEVFPIPGVNRNHGEIAANLYVELGVQLRRGPCRYYPSDMRVRVSGSGLYTYPDASVVRGEPRFADDHVDTLLNPTLLVEVLSPSTESYDRGRKFAHYRAIESLEEYVLIVQDRISVEVFVRQPDGRWLLAAEGSSLDQTVELSSIHCRLALADLYERVDISA